MNNVLKLINLKVKLIFFLRNSYIKKHQTQIFIVTSGEQLVF